MTIKAFSREYFKQWIANKLISIDIENIDFTTQKYGDTHITCDIYIPKKEKVFTIPCSHCPTKFNFTHPSQASKTDLICECGYTVIEYDKE